MSKKIYLLEAELQKHKELKIEERLKDIEILAGQQKIINKVVSATFTIAITALMAAIVELIIFSR